jgi:hypothetical protein
MKRKNILSLIEELMRNDSIDYAKQSSYILDEYKKANKETKKALDNSFIALCGYSLESLINKPRKYFDFGSGW